MARQSIQTAVIRMPERPAFSTQGSPVKLWANSFTVDLKAQKPLWVYNIEVRKKPREATSSSKTKSKGVPKKGSGAQVEASVKGPQLSAVISEACRRLKGANIGITLATELKAKLVSTGQIPQSNHSMEFTLPDGTYIVTLEGGRSVDLGAMVRYIQDMRDQDSSCPKFEEAVDALNIVLGHTARNDSAVSVIGSKRFFHTGGNANTKERRNLFCGVLGICRGYFQSLRLSTGRLLLNTNVTYGVFRLERPLAEAFTEARIDRANYDQNFEMMAKVLNRARVEYKFKACADDKEWRTQRKTIIGIFQSGTRITSEDVKIDNDQKAPGPAQVHFRNDGKFISVKDCFKQKYNMTLNDQWPLLNTGTPTSPRFTPVEVCTLLATAVKTKLNEADSEAMIKFACRPPGDNYHFIKTRGRALLHHQSDNLGHFGLQVQPELITVHARELPAPTIEYGPKSKDAKFQPKFGGWNMMNKKFAISPQGIVPWGCMAFLRLDEANAALGVARAFQKHVNDNCGLAMEQEPVSNSNNAVGTCHFRSNDKQILEAFKKHFGPKPPRIILVFLNKDTVLYGSIKRVCEVQLGVHTVCMDWRKAKKCQAPYFGNVALKWNLKMGGANHHLNDKVGLIREGETMIVGYDVTHPTNMPEPKKGPGGNKGPETSESPSIVGLVASIDKNVNQWPAAAWVHTSRMEVCEDEQLRDAFLSRLDLWKKHNANYPENIIIYRDGVSEGQFHQVLEKELPRIRAACEKRYKANKLPRLAIMVSVKRHHTRFYPTAAATASKSRNIRPGTVVDRGVTQARYWDFYLAAHDCLQGTARPAHYTVLLDEIFRERPGATPVKATEDLETITHDLCYMFGRATRAVSICPPAYYADILCERIRIHRGALPEGGKGPWKVHPSLQNEMYYI
ncbi:related to argonaute like post-transcriptional gene silencing protein QDE-2 [Cephalotrichum gorgonifer]|uniref:Related to argonaute like post-transcriptional gene silencing protein QDE-2 n=1 Tax=Cephalotrichum gorgonifer TaxID=2041049 RepID=A0AAE8SXL8_9PEZI|nr:related to argonaute like post-transcriptional gene silencing protein QDE-2 [Cephalotrichum gorgonifer]